MKISFLVLDPVSKPLPLFYQNYDGHEPVSQQSSLLPTHTPFLGPVHRD